MDRHVLQPSECVAGRAGSRHKLYDGRNDGTKEEMPNKMNSSDDDSSSDKDMAEYVRQNHVKKNGFFAESEDSEDDCMHEDRGADREYIVGGNELRAAQSEKHQGNNESKLGMPEQITYGGTSRPDLTARMDGIGLNNMEEDLLDTIQEKNDKKTDKNVKTSYGNTAVNEASGTMQFFGVRHEQNSNKAQSIKGKNREGGPKNDMKYFTNEEKGKSGMIDDQRHNLTKRKNQNGNLGTNSHISGGNEKGRLTDDEFR